MSDIQQAGNAPVIPATANGSGVAAEPRGIGGWLLLVALGQVLGLVRMLVVVGQYYLDPENMRFFELYPLAMYGELAMNACILALSRAAADERGDHRSHGGTVLPEIPPFPALLHP